MVSPESICMHMFATVSPAKSAGLAARRGLRTYHSMYAAFIDVPPAFACVTRVSTVLLPMYGCDSQPVSARGDGSDPPPNA
jgi:hypothetical protein